MCMITQPTRIMSDFAPMIEPSSLRSEPKVGNQKQSVFSSMVFGIWAGLQGCSKHVVVNCRAYLLTN